MNGLWDEVADGVFRRRYERWDQNVSLIVTTEGLVVVDSRSTHADADELRSDLTTISPLPVRFLVNTHFHWDHTFGNARFREAAIVGHRRCREVMIEDGEATKVRLSTEEWMPPEVRPDFLDVDITPPDVTFADDLSIHLGGRNIDLRHLGWGHTDADVVAFVDDTVIAGDLVEQGAPPSFGDSFPRTWISTLDALIPLIAGTVVPGHGDMVDRAFVEAQRDEMAAAIESIDSGSDVGPYPAEVTATVVERLGVEAARIA